MNQAVRTVRRGDVYLADLNPAIGCEQGGIRPVLVLQNDIGNLYSPTTIVAAVTAKQTKKKLAGAYTHICLYASYRFHATFGTNPHHRQVQAQRLSWQHKSKGNARHRPRTETQHRTDTIGNCAEEIQQEVHITEFI